MAEIDYEELIRSPLDDGEETASAGWSAAVFGAVLGLVLGYILFGTLQTGEQEPAAMTSDTTTTTEASLEQQDPDFPPGYVEISDGLGAVPNEVILEDDAVTIGFTTAARRGRDPANTAWPLGGNWLIETGSGAVVESSRVVVGRFSPGAFSVRFPTAQLAGETVFARASVVERWDVEEFTGSVEVPFAGEPFATAESVSVPVSQDVTLIIPELRLGRFLGSVQWQTTGAPIGATVHIEARLLDGEGNTVGSYGRFPEIVPPGNQGAFEIYWSEPFPTDQEGAVTVSLEYVVGVVTETPVAIEFDLSDVSVGR